MGPVIPNTRLIDFKFDRDLLNKAYTSHYFIKTCKIIELHAPSHSVIMQFTHFSKTPIMVCGTSEVLALLEFCLSRKELKQLKIYYVPDGHVIEPKEALFAIEGPCEIFGWLENIIDSILARRSSVATNCYNVLNVINDEQKVIYMSDRSDDYSLQPYDGYAAAVGGMQYFVTQKQVEFLKDINYECKVMGSMPHALIQQNNGRVDLACEMFAQTFPNDPLIAVIDYNNNVLNDLEQLRYMFDRLYAVRIDTAKDLIDNSLLSTFDNVRNHDLHGCNPYLIDLVREYLDNNGGEHIKIIASSAIDLNSIKNFNKHNSAIDFYGIGTYLTHLSIHITADLVCLDNVYGAKVGCKIAKNFAEMTLY